MLTMMVALKFGRQQKHECSSGFAHILVFVVFLVVIILTISYLFAFKKNDTVLGTTTTDPDRLYVINDTRACNAFNIRSVDNYANLTFDQSLQIVLNTLDNNRNEPTSVLVNRYGPWCDNEAHPAGALPFAYNLFYHFVDRFAHYGAERYRVSSDGSWASLPCRTPVPRKLPRPEDVGVACNAFTLRASPGDPYFDYYRGTLTVQPYSCTLKTHAFPAEVGAPTVINTFINDDPDYLGNFFNDQTNPDLYNLRRKQMKHIVYSAQERNINPYLVLGLWATESGFSNRPTCLATDDTTEKYQVVIRAYGTHGADSKFPIMVLKVNGVEVKRWTVKRSALNYVAYVDTNDISKLRVHFINDDGPRNLYVLYLRLGARVFRTTDPNTYSVGSWDPVNLCNGGKKQQIGLHCNGYFWFNAP